MIKESIVYIYKLIDPRDKTIRYIGQTSRNLCIRHKEHCYKQKKGSHRAHWLNQLHSLGLKPIMEVLEECDESNWQERERQWISYYREQGCNLVNATDGGEGLVGLVHTEVSRMKMSLSHKGVPLTEERKRNMSIAQQRPEVVQKKRRALLGRRLTEETKRKIGDSGKGKKRSSLTRDKLRIALRGETNARSKLTKDLVIEIKHSKESHRKLANRYGVSRQQIGRIKSGENWGWIK